MVADVENQGKKNMDFATFWQLYPRKIAKRAAEKAWIKLSTTEQQQALEAIPCHIRYWKARDTQQEFIPHASTWLNQGRWEDEIEIKQSTEIKVAWWSSESAMLAKGKEYNIAPRPGEDWQQFKGRLASLIQRAA